MLGWGEEWNRHFQGTVYLPSFHHLPSRVIMPWECLFVLTWPAHMQTSKSQAVTLVWNNLAVTSAPLDLKHSSVWTSTAQHECCLQREPFVWLSLEKQLLPQKLSFGGAPYCCRVKWHNTQLCFLLQVPLLLQCWFSSSLLPFTCGSLRRSPWGLPRRLG